MSCTDMKWCEHCGDWRRWDHACVPSDYLLGIQASADIVADLINDCDHNTSSYYRAGLQVARATILKLRDSVVTPET